MGLTLFEPAPMASDEAWRERAVQASGALDAAGDPVLGAIVETARRRFGTGKAAISILHADWQYIIAAAGLPLGAYSRRTSFCGHMVERGGGIFCVPDARRDPRFAGNPSVLEGHGVRFYAGAPVRNDSGVVLGALCIFDDQPRERCPDGAAEMLTALVGDIHDRLATLREQRAGLPPVVAA